MSAAVISTGRMSLIPNFNNPTLLVVELTVILPPSPYVAATLPVNVVVSSSRVASVPDAAPLDRAIVHTILSRFCIFVFMV
jgi:hypothetical protein